MWLYIPVIPDYIREHCLLYTLVVSWGRLYFETGNLRVFLAAKRHQDHSISYKKKNFIGASMQFQRLSPLLSWREAWQCAGRHVSGEGAESSISTLIGSRKWTGLSFWDFEAQSPSDIISHQSQTYCNRATSLIVPFPVDQVFKHVIVWGPFLFKPRYIVSLCNSPGWHGTLFAD